MSTIAVAKKDFKDGIRSWSLIGLTVLFALFLAGLVYFLTEISGNTQGRPKMLTLLGSMLQATYLVLPIVGTMVGYKAIVGERTSGSLKFLLGLPHTRWDIMFGKLLGRSAIVTVAVLIGFAVGGIVFYAFTTAFDTEIFLIFTAVTILLGVTFVSIAIAFSSMTRSSSIAISGAITLILLFVGLWKVFLEVVKYAAEQLLLIDPSATVPPDWLLFLRSLNPTNAYGDAVTSLIALVQGMNATIQSQPFYLQDWFGFVILSFWLVVPIGLAYLRFRNADL